MLLLRSLVFPCLLAFCLPSAFAGWSFDTAVSPETARNLFAGDGDPAAPLESWLRVRGLEYSAVYNASGAEVPGWPGMPPPNSIAGRRAALAALRAKGYRLVALIGWSVDSWKEGVRGDQPLRRLPLDLREAADRCRALARTYGDLIDYWEIYGEPDISFVEENPETYAALMKASALAFKTESRSGVLNAAFALPPGPYFESWVANDALRYLDGFNYHYYGYAEDFTGVHHQFAHAVLNAPAPASANESVFTTRFHPPTAAWKGSLLLNFSTAPGDTDAQAAQQARPLATHEPALAPQRRWLVTPGVSVQETADGWVFTVTHPSGEPMRPAMAELPLGTTIPYLRDAGLAFQFRAEPAALAPVEPRESVSPAPATSRPLVTYPSEPPVSLDRANTRTARRPLPVFVTEYGYGLLNGDARRTPGGREAQRAWFESTARQARALGIARAFAFNLRPDYSVPLGEFGLLMNAESAPPVADSSPLSLATPAFTGYVASPALRFLLETGQKPVTPQDWTVHASAPLSVIIDFVAGAAIKSNKTRTGYEISDRAVSSGQLILYNFGPEASAGQLDLEGAWTFSDATRARAVRLEPNERRALIVLAQLQPTAVFAAQPATARFRLGESHAPKISAADLPGSTPSNTSSPQPPSSAPARTSQQPVPTVFEFDAYMRTRNGNLYQTWPRLRANDTWQWYVQPFASFTPAFFGRAHLPATLTDDSLASLVFFFRPQAYPAIYFVRNAGLVEFRPRSAAQ